MIASTTSIAKFERWGSNADKERGSFDGRDVSVWFTKLPHRGIRNPSRNERGKGVQHLVPARIPSLTSCLLASCLLASCLQSPASFDQANKNHAASNAAWSLNFNLTLQSDASIHPDDPSRAVSQSASSVSVSVSVVSQHLRRRLSSCPCLFLYRPCPSSASPRVASSLFARRSTRP